MAMKKYYIAPKNYQESSDEVAFIPNFDHNLIFQTSGGSWDVVRGICHRHNALLYHSPTQNELTSVTRRYGVDEWLFVGIRYKNGEWIGDDGNKISQFYWESSQPGNPEEQSCGVSDTDNFLQDNKCDGGNYKGLCIY